MSWFGRLLGKNGSLPSDEQPPLPGQEEILEALQRQARAVGKQGLRLEELESKLEAGFQDLRTTLESLTVSGASQDQSLPWDGLLDAMDLLDAAATEAEGAGPELAEGLRRVQRRLETFLCAGGIERLANVGTMPDGKLFRVVGTEDAGGDPGAAAEGSVSRVVRAAAVRGGHIVREGEVIVTRRTA